MYISHLGHRKWAKTSKCRPVFQKTSGIWLFEPFKLLVSQQLIGLTKTKKHNEKEASRYTYVVLDTKNCSNGGTKER